MKQKLPFAIEKISKHLLELNSIPLFGNAPPIDWEELSSRLANEFGREDFSVRLKAQSWKEPQEIQKLIKTSEVIKLSPMQTPLFWVMTKANCDKLTAFMLSEKPKKKAFSSQVLQDGYYRFLILQTLSVLQRLDSIEQMTLQLEEETQEYSIETPGLCMEIEISFDGSTTWGELIILDSFRKDWIQHFAAFPPPYFPTELSKKIPVDLGIQIGSVLLSHKEWDSLEPGDLLLPDKIAKNEKTYAALLTFKEISLFQARIKENHLEITDFAFNVEESMPESKNPEEDTLSNRLNFSEKQSKAIQDIPLQIHVEVAQLQMTLNELMNLSPGNTLELPIHADKKMTLTYRGEKVGVAELVSLGETLGLKILEI